MSSIENVVRSFFMETSYVARIYADSLRDNFVGYDPLDRDKFNRLRNDFEKEAGSASPHLASLLRIEAALIETMPDNVMVARFWAIDDRFQRVVPLATRTRYESSVPARGDAKWDDPSFVRDQQRALLDVIHSNYLVNIGREKSIKRLKLIILIALVIVAVAAAITVNVRPTDRKTGLVALVLAGILGSMLSVTNRLQAAVSRDATTEDGVYELTGLRVGWVGIVTSFLVGGAFALVVYGIVMAGVLDVAYPALIEPAGDAGNTVDRPDASEAQEAGERPPLSANLAASCDGTRGACPGALDQTARALGLQDATSYYKMLILAFLAGFAERFVPDILGRLNKQPQQG